jgi:2-octaprenyl-6-methoxyphenol hydroxylase
VIGDAARTVHPIAGQGFNLGLRDVAALTECLIDTARLGLDIGGPEMLRRFEQWRRFDSVVSAAAMDGLNRLFSNDNPALRIVRETGLGLTDRLPGLKRMFVAEAAGLTGSVPKLLQGELP